jgi:acyl-CoA thioesterase
MACVLFSKTLASLQPADRGWQAVIGEDWSQGRATFGGMVAALGNEAMRQLVPGERSLRGLDTTFIGPVFAGEVRIEAEILRVGRAVTVAYARLWSNGNVAATTTGIYGAARESALTLAPICAVGVPGAERLADRESRSAISGPTFLRHFAFRWAEGARPFAGTDSRTAKIYVRHRDTAPLTESHVVALIDCIPSVVLQLMSKPAPSSSLTWNVQFLRHDYSFPPDAWWRIDSEVNATRSGYSCESCTLLDPNGVPAALARQIVAVFG